MITLHYGSGPGFALLPPVTTQAVPDEELCDSWEKDLGYRFDGVEVHVWTGRPKRGARCRCGARTWA
jgi:hypothetical protein